MEVGEEAEIEVLFSIADGLCCISFALQISHFEQCCRASVGPLQVLISLVVGDTQGVLHAETKEETCYKTVAVFTLRGHVAMSGSTVVYERGRRKELLASGGRRLGCCQISYNVADSTPTKNYRVQTPIVEKPCLKEWQHITDALKELK